VHVIPHGVEATGRSPAPDGPFVFLGTLAPHKGPDLVLSAWERAGRPAPLHLYGPPGIDLAWANRLPHRGVLPAERVPAILGAARALVLGSRWPENAPLVILEARAAGCPVIAPRIGGIPELVEEGVDGWLYAPGDVDALASALTRPLPAPRTPPSLADHLDAITALYATLV
jgi:glycosyltransferase involved in cell wall biosynthesis